MHAELYKDIRMSLIDVIFLSIALAMDCFTVSIVSGVIMRGRSATERGSVCQGQWGVVLRMSFLFGFFQAVMPFLGWCGFTYFAQYIEAFDHWISFGLLAFLGVRMIRESFLPEEEQHFDPCCLKTQLTLAVATSIDALAVGISFACTEYRSLSSLAFPLAAIGVTSFLFGVFGNILGFHFGNSISKRLKPELLGGVILILIGIKVLLSHLLES